MLGSIDKETGEVIGIALEDALLPTLPELPSRRLVTRRSDPPSSRKVQIAKVGDLFKEPSLGNARILEDQLTGLSNSDPTLAILSLPPVDDFVLGHSVLLPFVFCFPPPYFFIIPGRGTGCTGSRESFRLRFQSESKTASQ
jgi:hypothetical protein